MKQQLQELLHKDMSRQEFVTALGLAIISMFGFSSALKFLLEHNSKTTTTVTTQKVASGYGSTAYGR